MGGSEKGRQQGRWWTRGTRAKGAGREGAGPPPRIEGGEDGGQRHQREGGRGNGGGLGGWEPGAP